MGLKSTTNMKIMRSSHLNLNLIRYLDFMAEAHRHYELSVEHVLMRNFPSLLSMLRISFLRHVIALHPFESIVSPSTAL